VVPVELSALLPKKTVFVMRDIYLGLGSNIGDKKSHLERALEHITKFMTVLRVASLYETAPVGNFNQDWFLNTVIEVDILAS